MLSIFITSGYLLQSVTEEKENRVVEIMLSSIPALPLMAGKVLGLGAAGLTQVAIWVVTALIALPLANRSSRINLTHPWSARCVLAFVFFTLGYLRTARSSRPSARSRRASARLSSTRASSASSR